ncbi:MAG: histidine kinase [Actinomycetota bacterium]|nr:histidine kinase [Actinomycetota bacterium]
MLRDVVAPTGRLTRWSVIAIAVCAAAWSAAAASVVVNVVATTPAQSTTYWLMDVVSAVLYGAAALLMLPRSRHPVVWILVAVAIGCGIACLVTQLVLLSGPDWRHDQGLFSLYLLSFAAWMPGNYGMLAVMPWLVTPRGATPAVRAATWVGVAVVAVCVISLVTDDRANAGASTGVTWEPWRLAVDALGRWPDRACVALGGLGTVRLVLMWWRLRSTEATGYGWLALGHLLVTVTFIPLLLTPMEGAVLEASGVSLIIAQGFLPIALLVVVLRQQLWGIDLGVSRVTVWTLMTGAVLVSYATLVALVGQVLPESRGVAGFVVVGLVVAVGQPLRLWIQERVDRLVYGEAADPVRLLGSLGADFGDHGAGSSLEALTDALQRGLRLGGVEVRSTAGEVKAASGVLSRPDLELPLGVEGRRLGHLLVSAPSGQRVDPRTRRLVEQMVGVLGVALELAQVNERLATTSGRLVEVRHEERRMLRRDIHDGMGPALAGVGLGLAAAQRRLSRDPEGTALLLAELEAEVERRTEDVRLLARALLPAQLDDGDLGRALEVLADRFRSSGLVVETGCRVSELDTRRQVAVYHVAAEALMNAYRHARAGRVGIDVTAGEGGSVVLEVVDDGRGVSDDRGNGIGLQSMRERSAELGAELTIGPRSDGPGTQVRMVLP